MGLGFLMETAYLLPLTATFLALAVFALGFRARRRRGYGPLAVGLAAAGLLLVGKFVLDSAVAALVGASLWNAWPARPATGVPSAPAGTLYQLGGIEKEK